MRHKTHALTGALLARAVGMAEQMKKPNIPGFGSSLAGFWEFPKRTPDKGFDMQAVMRSFVAHKLGDEVEL